MKVTYIEKGKEINFKRVDKLVTFIAISSFSHENTSLIYFKINEYIIKAIPKDDIVSIEK